MLGMRSLIVEVLSRSVLTSNELLSQFADRYNLPDPTRPGGLERWQAVANNASQSVGRSSDNRRPISMSPIATTFVDTFDNSVNAGSGIMNIAQESTQGDMRKLTHIAERMCGLRGLSPLTIKHRKWRLHSYKNCWVGREAVDWLIAQGMADSVRQAVMIATRMMKHQIFSKVSSDTIGIFHNAQLFYKFQGDYRWPLMEMRPDRGANQDRQHWTMIEAEFHRLKLPKLDLARLFNDLLAANLARHQKLSISTPYNAAVSTSTQGTAATTVVGSANSSLAPTSSLAAPTSPTGQLHVTTAHELCTALRRSSHFQGHELVRHLKKHNVVTTTRDAVILTSYLLLMPLHAPQCLPTGAEAYFLIVGREGCLPSHVCQKVEQIAWVETQREREAASALAAQASQASTHQNTTLVNGVLTLADDGTSQDEMISAPRKHNALSSAGASSSSTGAGEILLPHKEMVVTLSPPLSPHLSKTTLTAPAYHNFLRERAATLSFDLLTTFKNADVWYRVALPLAPAPAAANTLSPPLQLPGAVPLTPSPLGPIAHPTVPSLGLTSLPVDAILDASALPSLVRSHYASTMKTLPASSATISSVFPSHTPDLQEWNWEFVQSFGDDSSSYDFDDADDLVTAVEFNPTGEYLAIGDKAGRVSIVQETVTDKSTQSLPLEYKFYTEFQSHDAEFDCLKSVEIEPKINVIEWWRHTASHMMLLTSNDKTIKLWRLGSKSGKKSMDSFIRSRAPAGPNSTAQAEDDGIDRSDEQEADEDQPFVGATRKQCFKNAHGYNIHSVSVNSDGASFFSADDLRINLWNVEREDECYTIVDLKPPTLTEVDELITVARFHPRDCATLMHGSSKGVIRLADLRQRALVDRSSSHMYAVSSAMKNNYLSEPRYQFSEITDSILDAQFSEDGRYILSRDYMTLRLWDTHNTAAPVHQAQVHPYLHTQFVHLLDNESIFDQFQCAMSRDGLHFVSGTYSNSFTLHNVLSHRTVTITARDDAREPLLINQHYNYENGAVGYERPALSIRQPWRSNTVPDSRDSDFAPQTLNNINVIGAAGDNVASIDLGGGGGTEPPPLDTSNPAHHFDQLNPTEPPNYRKKVLKVAWHPRMNAVAVAGLYKLYLYQSKPPNAGAGAAF